MSTVYYISNARTGKRSWSNVLETCTNCLVLTFASTCCNGMYRISNHSNNDHIFLFTLSGSQGKPDVPNNDTSLFLRDRCVDCIVDVIEGCRTGQKYWSSEALGGTLR